MTLGTLPLLPALQHLEVASTDTDDAGLLALEHQPALARLSIADCQVTAAPLITALILQYFKDMLPAHACC